MKKKITIKIGKATKELLIEDDSSYNFNIPGGTVEIEDVPELPDVTEHWIPIMTLNKRHPVYYLPGLLIGDRCMPVITDADLVLATNASFLFVLDEREFDADTSVLLMRTSSVNAFGDMYLEGLRNIIKEWEDKMLTKPQVEELEAAHSFHR